MKRLVFVALLLVAMPTWSQGCDADALILHCQAECEGVKNPHCVGWCLGDTPCDEVSTEPASLPDVVGIWSGTFTRITPFSAGGWSQVPMWIEFETQYADGLLRSPSNNNGSVWSGMIGTSKYYHISAMTSPEGQNWSVMLVGKNLISKGYFKYVEGELQLHMIFYNQSDRPFVGHAVLTR